jgi:hypothetical protein
VSDVDILDLGAIYQGLIEGTVVVTSAAIYNVGGAVRQRAVDRSTTFPRSRNLSTFRISFRQAVPMTQAQIGRRQPGELFRTLTELELPTTRRPDGTLRGAMPIMRQLADKVRETCHLSMIPR